MLGIISNSVGRSYGFPNEFAVSDTSCPMFEPRIRHHQVGYEDRPEVLEVEDSIPSARVRECAKTLESDLLVSYVWLSGGELVCNLIWQWVPAEGTDIPVRRIQFPTMQDWGTEKWPVTLELEDIANDVCVEFCNSHGLIPILNSCLDQARLNIANIENLFADLDYFEDDELEDTGHIVIRVHVCAEQKTALDEYDAWLDWFVDNVDDKNRSLITLTIQRV